MPKIPKNRNFYENRPIFSQKIAKSGGFLRVCGDFRGVFCVFALSCPGFCVFFVNLFVLMVVFWYNYSINEGDNMKKLSVLFVLLCLPTFAFGDVCSLSFRGGYKTAKEVVLAIWFDNGGVLFIDAMGQPVWVNGRSDFDEKKVSLDKLESVNGKHILAPNFLSGRGRFLSVFFNCDKWQNGEYFAYGGCGVGFQGVNKVGVYHDRDYTVGGGIDIYDECIKKAQTSDKNGGVATSTTKSGDDNNVTEGESAEEAKEIEKSDDVFAKIDVDLIKYFSKSSVWKNDKGKFNTARLASDSIAGVVLGTTGGIITSNVIKKNQIKKGFEDLKCTIGGQSVAAYGDEFSVGVK